ncbi:phage tail protein, partial [Escherichia coli]
RRERAARIAGCGRGERRYRSGWSTGRYRPQRTTGGKRG